MYKTCSKCKIEKLLSCFNKNKSAKDGLTSRCKLCVKEYSDAHYKLNKDKVLEAQSVRRKVNKEHDAAYAREYHISNKSKISEYQKARYRANKPQIAERHRKWRKKNIAKSNALTAKYRALKLKATPNWLTAEHLEQIESFYIEAQRLSLSTEIPHHVDHIVPLQGKVVCGLHVPWNLQVLTAVENISKSNKLQEDII